MIRISQIKVEVTLDQDMEIRKSILKKLRVNNIINYKIVRRSIDARDKNRIFYVYEIDVEVENEGNILKYKDNNISLTKNYEYKTYFDNVNKDISPLIVGLGPAGLFAAYILVLNGIRPIIIERGNDIDNRVKTVEEFWLNNNLKSNSNVQFGEGGAGTFSDGKLNTLSKDKDGRNMFVLETFVKFGANPDILISSTPHIGTDILRDVVKNMREYLIENGTDIYFNTCLTNIDCKNDRVCRVEVNNKEWINTENVILAIGHSARDTFRMLDKSNIKMQPKPFAVGFRIMHPQSLINESQYGEKYKDLLGAANYKLTYQTSNGHGIYSFCMCPGGYVVNASSEEGRIAINGMSNFKRDSGVANSALVVTVNEAIYGNKLFSGLEFQEKLESDAYKLGEGLIPIQLLNDYYQNIKSSSFNSIKPKIKGNYCFTNLNSLLPEELNFAIKEGIINFAKKIKNFDHPDAILAGIESRTSSPIRIMRDETYNSNIKGIYPCGEGAGYAGGIMTSAIDGMKVAEAIIANN